MPIVFVLAQDWTLRTALRAELRERGFLALGMETPDEVGEALASGEMPRVMVVEATARIALDPAIKKMMEAVPTILIASRTEVLELPKVAALFYRPVRIAEIVDKVGELVRKGRAV